MPTDLQPAPPEVLSIVNRLIDSYFPHLKTARLVIAVRAKAEPVEDDKATVAATGVNDDAGNSFDYICWFALDAWQLLDEREREAIVFHELMHCGRDEAGRPALIDHDAQVFTAEVERYGAWWKSAQARFEQRN